MLCLWERGKIPPDSLAGRGRAVRHILYSRVFNNIAVVLTIPHLFRGALCQCCVAASEIGTVILLIVPITHALHLI